MNISSMSNLNNISNQGNDYRIYAIGSNSENKPSSSGCGIVIAGHQDNYAFEFAIDTSAMYFRNRNSSGTWSSWRTL